MKIRQDVTADTAIPLLLYQYSKRNFSPCFSNHSYKMIFGNSANTKVPIEIKIKIIAHVCLNKFKYPNCTYGDSFHQ